MSSGKWLRFVSVLSVLVFVAGCGGGGGGDDDSGDTTPPDPVGTITTSINYRTSETPIILYEGLGEDGPYYPRGTTPYPYAIIAFGMNNSLNFVYHTSTATILDHGFTNPEWDGLGSYGGEAASVGPVDGLGEVTEKPAAGWSTSTMVEPGYGYVVRYKHSINYSDPEIPYHYARVYAVEWLLNVLNEIIGVKLKYQNEF